MQNDKAGSESTEFHLQYFPGPDLLGKWPDGCWVVFRATAKELVNYQQFNAGGAYPPPGHLGTRPTLREAVALIEASAYDR